MQQRLFPHVYLLLQCGDRRYRNRLLSRFYFAFLPAIIKPSLLVLLLAVAVTLALSFFGFLTSRLFAPVPLDMRWLLMAAPVCVMLDGSILLIGA
jgi:magnesium-transporting ATPase (P-type)